ncbi:hypothetical protein ACWEQL_23200 [Kitasatospora sp. NPDC004240]
MFNSGERCGGAGGHMPRTAIYLRCYPADLSGLDCHRRALEDLARATGLPEPRLFLDNGRRAGDELPAWEALLAAASAGWIDTVLVPGPFVFGLDRGRADAMVESLARRGCRVVDLPSRAARTAASRATVAPLVPSGRLAS